MPGLGFLGGLGSLAKGVGTNALGADVLRSGASSPGGGGILSGLLEAFSGSSIGNDQFSLTLDDSQRKRDELMRQLFQLLRQPQGGRGGGGSRNNIVRIGGPQGTFPITPGSPGGGFGGGSPIRPFGFPGIR